MKLMDDIFSVLDNSDLGIKGMSQRMPTRRSKGLRHNEHALSITSHNSHR